MLNPIDYILNRVTMYRLVLYYLIVLLLYAGVLSFFHLLSFNPLSLILSTIFLVVIAYITNETFSYVFKAPTNVESVYIMALILALIVNPIKTLDDVIFLAFAAVLSMASKYIMAIDKKHIFNPVAIAVVLTSMGFGASASWWVGNLWMMPVVVVGGLLITRKIRREDLVFSFCFTVITITGALTMIKGADLIPVFSNVFFHSSIFFLAFVMLTEPLTTPPTHVLQVLYGVMVGILYIPQLHIGNLYTTPEIALVLGNVFSYIVSPKTKIIAYVAQRLKLTPDTFDFIFGLDKKLSFIPGQYMEWTLQHPNSDSRGNRRYFTIASSPTENNVRLGIKFYQPASSFKKALLSMTPQSLPIVGTQIAGDFTLPQNPSKKLVFLAGGIGITPFRSMLKYLIDTNQARDIVLLYSNKNISEIVYQDVLTQAQMQLKIKVLYTLTDTSALPAQWQGKVGRVNPEMIQQEIPDYRERIFYLSGPHAMVKGFESVLHSMGVSKSQIKTDFFPGFV